MRLLVKVGVIFAGGVLGTAARMGLLHLLRDEVIALAAINVLGCLLLGLVSGIFGPRVTALRLFLAVGGLGAFTSWSSLAMQGVTEPGGVVIVLLETAVGVAFAGLGHLLGRRWRREGEPC